MITVTREVVEGIHPAHRPLREMGWSESDINRCELHASLPDLFFSKANHAQMIAMREAMTRLTSLDPNLESSLKMAMYDNNFAAEFVALLDSEYSKDGLDVSEYTPLNLANGHYMAVVYLPFESRRTKYMPPIPASLRLPCPDCNDIDCNINATGTQAFEECLNCVAKFKLNWTERRKWYLTPYSVTTH